jgi:hypothetical protein
MTYYDHLTIEDTVTPLANAVLDLLEIVEHAIGHDSQPWERLDWKRTIKAAKSAAHEASRLPTWAMTRAAVAGDSDDSTTTPA